MSNTQSWTETFAPIQAAHRQEVFKHTWGHLAPEGNKSYKGSILFSISDYAGGSIELIATNFEDLPDSPWIYEFLNELIAKHSDNLQHGCVYRIDGTFRNYRMYGQPKKVYSL